MTFELPPARDLHDAASTSPAFPACEASARLADLATLAAAILQAPMGVEVLEQSPERVVATMPVDGNRQSLGLRL